MIGLLDKLEQNHRLTLWGIICLALVGRIVWLVMLGGLSLPDAQTYATAGQDLFTTGLIKSDLVMPLYPIWTLLTGGGWGTKVADVLVSVTTVYLLHQLTFLLSKSALASLGAAMMAAIYPFFIFYSAMAITETLYLFLICLAFYWLYQERYIWAFLAMVLSILLRPSLDLLAPLLILSFVWIVHRRSFFQGFMRLGQYALIYVVLLTPWWVHNHVKYDQFVRLSLGDGLVLYAGNNPLNQTGGGVIDQANGIIDLDASGFAHLREDPVAWRAALRDAAFTYIEENPERFVEMAAVKFVRFWRLWPFAPDFQSPVHVAASLVSFGTVLMGSLAFLILHGIAHWRQLLPLIMFAGYLTAIHMVTIGSIRYRLPIEPFMIMLAAMQFELWIRHFREKGKEARI